MITRFGVLMVSFSVAAGSAGSVEGCDRQRTGDGQQTSSPASPGTAFYRQPLPAPQRPQAPSAAGQRGEVIWDLPTDDEATSRNRASSPSTRPTPPQVPCGEQTSSRSTAGDRPAMRTTGANQTGQTSEQRLNQLLEVRDSLTADQQRLLTKKTELLHWDRVGQEKFYRAFNTTDEYTRAQVLRRIDELLQRNLEQLAAVKAQVDFEVFLQSKKRP